MTDWKTDFDLPDDVIKGAVLSSGLYDLKSRTAVGALKNTSLLPTISSRSSVHSGISARYVHLWCSHTEATRHRNSNDKRTTLREALEDAGKPCRFFINENYNHFEMMETFGNPFGLLGRAVLTQMELETP